MISPARPLATTFAAALCAVLTHAQAAGFPKEGRFDTTECLVAEGPRTESPAGITFGGIVSHNVAHAPGGGKSPLDEYGTFCVGYYVENKAGKSYADGICEQTDRDGDKWVLHFHDDGNAMAGTFEFVAGTGKYTGAKIEGQFRPDGPMFFGSPGRMQRCLHVTGTYRLR